MPFKSVRADMQQKTDRRLFRESLGGASTVIRGCFARLGTKAVLNAVTTLGKPEEGELHSVSVGVHWGAR